MKKKVEPLVLTDEQLERIREALSKVPKSCPSCGRCNECGRGGYDQPWRTLPYVPQDGTWYPWRITYTSGETGQAPGVTYIANYGYVVSNDSNNGALLSREIRKHSSTKGHNVV